MDTEKELRVGFVQFGFIVPYPRDLPNAVDLQAEGRY